MNKSNSTQRNNRREWNYRGTISAYSINATRTITGWTTRRLKENLCASIKKGILMKINNNKYNNCSYFLVSRTSIKANRWEISVLQENQCPPIANVYSKSSPYSSSRIDHSLNNTLTQNFVTFQSFYRFSNAFIQKTFASRISTIKVPSWNMNLVGLSTHSKQVFIMML